MICRDQWCGLRPIACVPGVVAQEPGGIGAGIAVELLDCARLNGEDSCGPCAWSNYCKRATRRLHGEQAAALLSEGQEDGKQAAGQLVREQFRRVWKEISSERLKVDETLVAESLTKTLIALHEVDEGPKDVYEDLPCHRR